jgi:predicted alpha/beta superfamily hydrolase
MPGAIDIHTVLDREVVVYVPAVDCRCPVLYMQDGQNLFNPETAFNGQEWRMRETADTLIEAGEIEPLIIVGIYNTGDSRIDEYTPSRDRKTGRGGKAPAYGRMLVNKLKPFIDERYPTCPDARNTGLGGSSLGGLVSLALGLRYPEVFGKIAVMSPSVWWDRRSILKIVSSVEVTQRARIWLDVGTAEGPQTTDDARLLRDVLLAKGWREGLDLAYTEAPGASHDERSWSGRVAPMLKFLFGKAR